MRLLEDLLSAYEVTRVPQESSVHLTWDAVDGGSDDDGAPIVLLDAYRVSRVPHTVAS